ncbi:hypothetical protein AAEO56_17850 [Flavobacterium sp. DGU11]|uniref:Uncharacterized protein n=1 Tax=Flavobacterium arundinis TaxID=3139143 RepID=A0ABU9I2U7_9FLAO
MGSIASDRDLLMTGQQLSELDEDTFAATVEQIRVYARVSPEQKL